MSNAPFVVGFLGDAAITHANAEALLDDWMPIRSGVVIFPDAVPRTGGLRTVLNLMRDWQERSESRSMIGERWVEVRKADPGKLVKILTDSRDEGLTPYLVILLDMDDEATISAARDAIGNGIPVLALNEGLDDVELETEDSPTVPATPDHDEYAEAATDPEREGARRYGKPRENSDTVVEAKVAGPATIIGEELTQVGLPKAVAEDLHTFGLLETAIRLIVREEVDRLIGHRAHVEPLINEEYTEIMDPATEAAASPVEEQRTALWTDGENYQEPTGKRAPKGWRTVYLSEGELAAARDKGLI